MLIDRRHFIASTLGAGIFVTGTANRVHCAIRQDTNSSGEGAPGVLDELLEMVADTSALRSAVVSARGSGSWPCFS